MNIQTITDKLSGKMSIKIDQYIKLHIQPKPKWLPTFLWTRILKRLLVLEYMTEKEKREEIGKVLDNIKDQLESKARGMNPYHWFGEIKEWSIDRIMEIITKT